MADDGQTRKNSDTFAKKKEKEKAIYLGVKAMDPRQRVIQIDEELDCQPEKQTLVPPHLLRIATAREARG